MGKGRSNLEKSLSQLFKDLDKDGSGTLSKDEILYAIQKDPRVIERLNSLEIYTTKEEMLELFDTIYRSSNNGNEPDHDAEVEMNDFLKAMTQIRGSATSKELWLTNGEMVCMRAEIMKDFGEVEELARRLTKTDMAYDR